MNDKRIIMPITDFKYEKSSGKFSCYGNTKHNIDYVGDRAMDGCYTKSIAKHKANGTMPKMLWSHDPTKLPLGPWYDMAEDAKGLKMDGMLSKTTMGNDVRILAEDGALDSFSIGYSEVESEYNNETKSNDLLELDIHETSWVNFACNDESLLQDMKSKLTSGNLLTKRELQKLLQEFGFSNSQSKSISNRYDDKTEELQENIFELMAKSEPEIETQTKDIFEVMAKIG